MTKKETNPRGKGLSVEDIVDHGTPTQKAYKVLMEWRDLKNMQKKPNITDQEREDILDSMNETDIYYYKAYRHYTLIYSDVVIRTMLLQEHYEKIAERLKGLCISLKVEEELLTQVYNRLPESQKVNILNSPNMQLNVVECEEGVRLYFKKESRDWWSKAKEAQQDITAALRDLRNLFGAFDKFDVEFKKRNAGIELATLKIFRPRYIQEAIREVKEDFAKDIPEFSRKYLHDSKAAGDYVGPYDEERAIFPYYQEIEKDPKEVNWWYTNLLSFALDIAYRRKKGSCYGRETREE